jgi:hypothetical protein
MCLPARLHLVFCPLRAQKLVQRQLPRKHFTCAQLLASCLPPGRLPAASTGSCWPSPTAPPAAACCTAHSAAKSTASHPASAITLTARYSAQLPRLHTYWLSTASLLTSNSGMLPFACS